MNVCKHFEESESRARLYPSITNPNWLVLRARREIFRGWLKSVSAPGMTVLDIGGRIQPYRSLMPAKDTRYIAIDLRLTSLVDIIADASRLPFSEAQYDLVICTQVLEYVSNPFETVAEIRRVLKPGGFLLLSVPSLYPSDSPMDGWRYFPAAIRRLTAEFSAIEIAAEGGSVVGLFRTLNVWLDWFARPAFLKSLIRHTAIPMFNLTALLLETAIRKRNEAFSPNFSVLARR
jgi:SAM-dependent methyltransferase